MANCSDQKHPLQRGGTAQTERLLPGLQTGYVLADEHSFADWIVFAKEFSAYVNYYELTNEKKGNWNAFFNSDVSAVLGTIAVQDADIYKRSIKERFDFLKNSDHKTQLPAAKQKLHELFSVILTICEAMDEYCRLLPADIALKAGIENMAKNQLAPMLKRLLGYYKGAKPSMANSLLDTGNFTGWKVLGVPVKPAEQIINGAGLGSFWWKHVPAPASWSNYYNDIAVIPVDESIYGGDPDPFMRIYHAANHNLFAGVFDVFLMAYSKLIKDAEQELLRTLENRNTHPPHYALFLAFLKLFKLAQHDLNTVTQRHLDLYYKEILQLKQKPAAPNSAHVIAELAKPVEDFILPDAALFKAGKDSEGKEVLYKSAKETVFNKAVVKELRSVYLGSSVDNHPVTPNSSTLVINEHRLFAAPVINSADGMGAELTSPNKEWHPVTNRLFKDGKVLDVKMPPAQIGFAVASHYLYLQEGVRKIKLRFATNNNTVLTGKQYEVYITTEKEWYKVPVTDVSVVVNNNLNIGTESCAEFTVSLPGDAPAVMNYSSKVHGGTLGVSVPVMKIILVNDETLAYEYEALKLVTVTKVEVAVEVGNLSALSKDGVKNLFLSTDAGITDGSKPFQPFGAFPVAGNRLVIGNKEIFTKQNLSLSFNIEWKGLTGFSAANVAFSPLSDGGDFPNIDIKYLANGIWQNWITNTELFPLGVNVNSFIKPSASLSNTVISSENYSQYELSTKNGFVALQLNQGFGYKEYQDALALYLIGQSKNPKEGSAVTAPYIPVIQSLYISYSAFSDVVEVNNSSSNTQRQVSLFHLYPFGDAEQHASVTGETSHYLLPQFSHKNAVLGVDEHHAGEFYIGLQNLLPKQAVHILFQVMDGTADPTVVKPDEHIYWSYLSGNRWINFDPYTIADATLQLLQSGIISFVIPADATTQHTLMPAGFTWIKAAVKEKAEAICKLLSVQAQAAVVTFDDHNNAADFLNTALPEQTITKLKVPQSAVKKITQPYSSFGGRSLESNDAFYVRVSERLRHKARAITIWDYEHLLLEAFPLIHKVKCLSHTQSDQEYNEVKPGHVTIITIPDLKQRNDANPLKPYTSQSVLKSMEAFLKKKISCHVKLHVVNPLFEEVKLTFKLRLLKGFDDFTVYRTKLQEEITAFLSPWAYGNGDLNFGGIIYKSVLINFIEERPYVDFITDVELSHYDAKKNLLNPDADEVIASTAKSILVSVPASQHSITEADATITTEQYECSYIEQQKKPTLL
jgi:hypothetical protein